MDAMYRYQRYFYDFTRKYYLIGRDRLIRKMDIRHDDRVLEIGCGTGRNLLILAKKFADADFFGLDASDEMLKTARLKINSGKLNNVIVETALADDFDYCKTFNLSKPFDVIFFSYSISMITNWRQAIDQALSNLREGGSLYIVDFYDQKDLPFFLRRLLTNWLNLFQVHFRSGLTNYLEELQKREIGVFEVVPLARRYAHIIKFKKSFTSSAKV